MGKLKVIGKARKEYSCDVMYIKISFKTWEKNTSQAIEVSMMQCDHFLEILEEKGFSVDSIHMDANEVSQEMDDELEVSAERRIELRLPYDMAVLNTLSEIIKEHDFKVDVDVSFKLSNMIEVHNQLIKEAVMDSKKKAEMIAETMGQKVTGISEMNAGD